MKWINVKDKLPKGGDTKGEICENVILLIEGRYDEPFVTAGWMNGLTRKVYYLDKREDCICKGPIELVTHWMPLPKKPS